MAEFPVEVTVDSGPAVAGSRRVERGLKDIGQQADRTQATIGKTYATAGRAAKTAAAGAGVYGTAVRGAAMSSAQLAGVSTTTAGAISKVGMSAGVASGLVDQYGRSLVRTTAATATAGRSGGAAVDGLAGAWRGATGSLRAANVAMVGVVGAIAAVATALRGLGAAARARMEVEAVTRALSVVAGSTAAARVEYERIRDEANRLGLDLRTTAAAYGSMQAAAKGTALEGAGAREVFVAVSEAMTVLGKDSATASRALIAVQQMMSKGNVSAEELRQQLGEALPGAVQIMARGIGVTTAELGKMLEQGQVLAEEALPKFAAELRKTFGPQVAQAAESTQAAVNRMQTAMFELAAELGQLIEPATRAAAESITGMLSVATDLIGTLNAETERQTALNDILEQQRLAREDVARAIAGQTTATDALLAAQERFGARGELGVELVGADPTQVGGLIGQLAIVEDEITRVERSIRNAAEAGEEWAVQDIGELRSRMEELQDTAGALRGRIDETRQAMQRVATPAGAADKAIEDLTAQLEQQQSVLSGVSAEQQATAKAIAEASKTAGAAGASVDVLTEHYRALQDLGIDPEGEQAEALLTLRKRLEDATKTVDEYRQRQERAAKEAEAAAERERQRREAIEKTTASLKANLGILERVSAASRDTGDPLEVLTQHFKEIERLGLDPDGEKARSLLDLRTRTHDLNSAIRERIDLERQLGEAVSAVHAAEVEAGAAAATERAIGAAVQPAEQVFELALETDAFIAAEQDAFYTLGQDWLEATGQIQARWVETTEGLVQQWEVVRNETDATASAVQQALGGMTEDFLRTGEVNFSKAADALRQSMYKAIEDVVRKWAQARLATKTADISTRQRGGGGRGGGGGGRAVGGIVSQVGVASLIVVGIMAAIAIAIRRRNIRERRRQFEPAITTGFGAGGFTGEAQRVESARAARPLLTDAQAREFQNQMRDMVNTFRMAIGGVLTSMDEFGVSFQRSGKNFQAVFAGQVLGTFKTVEEALAAGLKAALARSEFVDLGENVRKVLVDAAKDAAIGLQELEQQIGLARTIDELALGLGEIGRQLNQSFVEFQIQIEQALDLGLDISPLIAARNAEIAAIKETVEAQARSIIGIGGQADAVLGLLETVRDMNQALSREEDQRAALLEQIRGFEAGRIQEITDGVEAFLTSAAETGETAAQAARNVGSLTDRLAALAGAATPTGGGAVGAAAAGGGGGIGGAGFGGGGPLGLRGGGGGRFAGFGGGGGAGGIREGISDAAQALREGLEEIAELIGDLPGMVDQELTDVAVAAGIIDVLTEATNLYGKITGQVELGAEIAALAREREMIELVQMILTVQQLQEASRGLGLISDETFNRILDRGREILVALERGELQPPAVRAGAGGGRREARGAFLERAREIQLAASGVSEALLDLTGRLSEIGEAADEARRLRVAAEVIQGFITDSLDVLTTDFMAPFREAVRQASETETETILRQLETERQAALAQAEAIARARADAGLGVFEEVFGELAATIDSAFDLERAQAIADAEAAATEATREHAEALAAEVEARTAALRQLEQQLVGLEDQAAGTSSWILSLRDLERQQEELFQSFAEVADAEQDLIRFAGRLEGAVAGIIDRMALDLLREADQFLRQFGSGLDPETTRMLAVATFELQRAQLIAALSTREYVAALASAGVEVADVLALLRDVEFREPAAMAAPVRRPPAQRDPLQAMSDLLRRMRQAIEDWLSAPIGAATRQAMEMAKEFGELRSEAIAAGVPIGQLSTAFRVAGKAMVDDLLRPFEEAGLSATQRNLLDVLRQFQDIEGALRAIGADAADWSRFAAAQDAALRDVWTSATSQIRQFYDELSRTNPLVGPRQQHEQAREQFFALAARAQAGDLDAVEQLAGAGQRFLAAIQAFRGGGMAGIAEREQLMAVLEGVLGADPLAAGVADPVVAAIADSNTYLADIAASLAGWDPSGGIFGGFAGGVGGGGGGGGGGGALMIRLDDSRIVAQLGALTRAVRTTGSDAMDQRDQHSAQRSSDTAAVVTAVGAVSTQVSLLRAQLGSVAGMGAR